MQCFSTVACTSNNVRGDFTLVSPRNCKQTWDLKGDKGTDFVSAMQLRACEVKFKSPCLPFWIKEFLNLRSVFLKEKFAILQVYKF